MGNAEVLPLIQAGHDIGYVAVVLRSPNKVLVIYETAQIRAVIHQLIAEFHGMDDHSEDFEKSKYGALQFKLPGAPFRVQMGIESATIGKKFICRLLEKMNSLGYDFTIASDLSRIADQSTLIFKKVCIERPACHVLCIAPGSYDKLIIVNHQGSDIDDAIDKAIETAWSPGKQNAKTHCLLQEELTEIKLTGTPWMSTGDETTESRQLLAQIVSNLSSIQWRFCASINIKGGTDSLFFIKDHQQQPMQSCIVSMNRTDRLRLIGFDNDIYSVQQCINAFYQPKNDYIKAKDYHGSTEFKLPGSPFLCQGSEAIKTRRFINRLIETLQSNGYYPITGIDISRKNHDKSVMALVKALPSRHSVAACIAMSDVDTIRLIDFPAYEQERLAEVIRSSYSYGLNREKNIDDSCLEIKLKQLPWHMGGPSGIQGKALLMHLLKKAHELNWQLVASLDVSAKFCHRKNAPDFPLDVHSWFFTKIDTEFDGAAVAASAPPMTFDQSFPAPPPSYEEASSSLYVK